MPPRFGGAPKCPRCEKSVYMAEQVLGPGGAWHNYCLTCKECSKRLDSTTLTEKDNEAYCKTCYNRTWGPKGYGFAGGAAFLSTENKMPKEILEENYNDGTLSRSPSLPSRATPSLPARSPTVPARQASPALAARQASPALPARQQNSPSLSRPELPSRPAPNNGESDHHHQQQQLSSPTKPTSSGGYTKHQTSYVPRKFNFQSQQDTCVGCGKTVYAAELVLGAGNKYHKMCLKCCQCGKRLDSTNMADRDFDLYCKGCYGKSFGPKGFGFSNLLTPEGATR